MKSLLEKTEKLDNLIRLLRKMESKMRSGQWIDAWRDCNAIIALVERSKKEVIMGSKEDEK